MMISKRGAAVDAALKGMFKSFEDRGVPEHVMRVVDQLEDAALQPARSSYALADERRAESLEQDGSTSVL